MNPIIPLCPPRRAPGSMKRLLACVLGVAAVLNAFSQNWNNPSERYADAYKEYLDAPSPVPRDTIKNYVYFAHDRGAIRHHPFLKHSRFEGAQIMYSWAQLEPSKDHYDFTAVREDFAFLALHGKRLFLQLQDATFDPAYKGVPDYLLSQEYDGGAVRQRSDDGVPEGWVAKRWNVRVRFRFSLLLRALGQEFDGKIEGINLQETAVGVSAEDDPTFTPAAYAEAIQSNMAALKQAFRTSTVMQYANFMPGEWLPWDDKGYLRAVYRYGETIGVGLGAPDLMVEKKGQLNHALAMMHENSFHVPIGIAVQDGNYIGETNTKKVLRKRVNRVPMLHAFAGGFLKVSYIFWSNQKPYFEEDVLPVFPSD